MSRAGLYVRKSFLKEYVIYEENNYWKCRSCQHKSNGHPTRMIAHLTCTPGKGIKTCPKISPEKIEELKRELGCGPRSRDVDDQQLQQDGEKDDTRQENGSKKRKCPLGSGTSGSDPTEAEMLPLGASTSSGAMLESISASEGNIWSLQNLEKIVNVTGSQLDYLEQCSPFSVSHLIASPLQTLDTCTTVPQERCTLHSHDQERAYVPNANNDGFQETNVLGSEMINTIHQRQSSQLDSIQVSFPQGVMDMESGDPIPPPNSNHMNDQHMHPLQCGHGINGSTFGNVMGYGTGTEPGLANPPSCPPEFPSDLWNFYRNIDEKGPLRSMPDFSLYGFCTSFADEEKKNGLACLASACSEVRNNINSTCDHREHLQGRLYKIFHDKFRFNLDRFLGRLVGIETKIRAEAEQEVQILGTKRKMEMNCWLGYVGCIKSNVSILDMDSMNAKSPSEILPLLKGTAELTKGVQKLIEMGLSLLNPVPQDLLSWNPSFMYCGSQLLKYMDSGQFPQEV